MPKGSENDSYVTARKELISLLCVLPYLAVVTTAVTKTFCAFVAGKIDKAERLAGT